VIYYDAIIVGAGPAGSSCAALLSQAGMRVMLCDRAKFPRHKICGDCINPQAWPLFEFLGIGDKLRQTGPQVIDGIRITNANGFPLAIPYTGSPNRPFVTIRRSDLDFILLHQAEKNGANVLESTTVRDVMETNGKWRIKTSSKLRNSQLQTDYISDLLIGADGRNSLIAQRIGNQSRLCTSGKDRIGMQWFTKHQPQISSHIELFLSHLGYFGLVNVDKQTANLAMVTTANTTQMANHNLSGFLQEIHKSNPVVAERKLDLTPQGAISTAFPIEPTRCSANRQNAFLIGDAAQTVEPFTGEGVLLAIQDGIRTANTILNKFH